MILCHSSPTTLEKYRSPELGVLCSPRRVYGGEMHSWPWAADNDAFSAWDEERYLAMLGKIAGKPNCLFVTSPDVVGDSAETLRLFDDWKSWVRSTGQPLALVGQDGMVNPPWEEFDALFIGGSTEWKCGEGGRALVIEAKRRGMWVHMGRVNSKKRMTMAHEWGCDSVDGTSVSMFRDTHLPTLLAHAAHLNDGEIQLTLGI